MIRRIFPLCFLILLCGCLTTQTKERSFTPLEYVHNTNLPVLEKALAEQNLTLESPVFIRAFKSEMQMEAWVKDAKNDEYRLFRTYPICRLSGKLGPKEKEGDLQSPEGFYMISPGQLNPNSKFYLSFDLGYPNAYDRAHKRTGNALMVHGNCLSKGCLAMNDNNIAEIYLLVEQSQIRSKKSVPVHIFPFRMTQENMDLRKTSTWHPFWQNLKDGYDLFEQTHIPPVVKVEKTVKTPRYAFNEEQKSITLAKAKNTKIIPAKDTPKPFASKDSVKEKPAKG